MSVEAQPRMNAKRLPARARPIYDLRLRGLVPGTDRGESAVIVSLDDWRWAEQRPWQIVVPADLEPDAVDWSPLAGLDCWVGWLSSMTPIGRRDALLRGLVRVMPRQLWVLDRLAPEKSFFIVSRVEGVLRGEFIRA